MENKSNLINKVNKMMENQQGNCAQAIFATFGPYITQKNLEFEYCMKITSAFGGGINLTGNVCGAITGSLMSLGLKFGEDYQKLTQISAEFIKDFEKINESIICRDLVGYEMNEVEKLEPADKIRVFNNCKKCVYDAACLLEKYIESNVNVEMNDN